MNANSLLSDFLSSGEVQLNYSASGDLSKFDISSIELDSRKCEMGTLFCAIDGTQVKGITFVQKALSSGAVAILCHPDDAPLAKGFEIILTTTHVPKLTGEIAAKFYGPAPENIIAVTGTNGKTSVASFFAQIVQLQEHESAQLGTMGLIAPGFEGKDTLTSPDSVNLHRLLAELKQADIDYVALEASSHGLVQRRMAGTKLRAIAFTNLSQDHLDYHKTMDAYFDAKSSLFRDYANPHCISVIHMDDERSDKLVDIVLHNEGKLIRVGEGEYEICLLARRVEKYAQILDLKIFGKPYQIKLPLVGKFQTDNALVSLGLAIGVGLPIESSLSALERLTGATGRLEFVGETLKGAAAIVDYAHTPDALEKALSTLRENVDGRLHIVFGAGGDRDPSKRVLMGQAANAAADVIWVTDDNPRTEDAEKIRKMVAKGAPKAVVQEDREKTICDALENANSGDIVLVAGKGHEQYQEIGTIKFDYSDHKVIRDFIANQSN